MPKTPQDFSKGLIYSIVCKTDETLLYVGSTTNFTQRKSSHKSTCNNENDENHNFPVYVMIRANGGWDSFNIKPVKEFPCESKIQLVIEEERFRVEMQAKLNTNRAYLSPEERKREHAVDMKNYQKANLAKFAEHNKKYHKANAVQIADRKKKYNQENSAKISDYKKKYREANAAKVFESQKKYREANAAKICEDKKKYQEANAAKLAEQRRRKF